MKPKRFKRIAGRMAGFVEHFPGQQISGTVVARKETDLAPYWQISTDTSVLVKPAEKDGRSKPSFAAPAGSLVGIQGSAYSCLDRCVGMYVLIVQGEEIQMGRGRNAYRSAEVFVADDGGETLASFGLEEPGGDRSANRGEGGDDIPF